MPNDFPPDFMAEILITPEQIHERVKEIGKQITHDYRDSQKLIIIGLLRGSVVFITDLMRTHPPPADHRLYVGLLIRRVGYLGVCAHRPGPQDQHRRLGCHPGR